MNSTRLFRDLTAISLCRNSALVASGLHTIADSARSFLDDEPTDELLAPWAQEAIGRARAGQQISVEEIERLSLRAEGATRRDLGRIVVEATTALHAVCRKHARVTKIRTTSDDETGDGD